MNTRPVNLPVAPTTPRDHRLRALALAVLGTASVGYLVFLMPDRGVVADAEAPPAVVGRADLSQLPAVAADEQRPESAAKKSLPQAPAEAKRPVDPQAEETRQILEAARKQIKAKRYDEAIVALHQARQRIMGNPTSYVVMGNALEGKKDYDTARDFYAAAIDRDPYMPDAYWGFATTSEALGELDAALGAMRSFLHVQPNADPQKLRIVQARSALWEWEAKLGRGPWGPTKGIPPGFSAEELRRDGRGVGLKVPRLETLQPDGSMKYDVRGQDKFNIFKP